MLNCCGEGKTPIRSMRVSRASVNQILWRNTFDLIKSLRG